MPLIDPKGQNTNHIYVYDLDLKRVRAYKPVCKSLNEIRQLKISELESEKDVRSGWVKFSNTKYDKDLKMIEGGKWVLRFPAGNPHINIAWEKLVDLIENGQLWDIKASAKTEKKTQIICVFLKDAGNLTEIVAVYSLLRKHGLLDLHMKEEINQGRINFITDQDVRKDSQIEQVSITYTNEHIEAFYELIQH